MTAERVVPVTHGDVQAGRPKGQRLHSSSHDCEGLGLGGLRATARGAGVAAGYYAHGCTFWIEDRHGEIKLRALTDFAGYPDSSAVNFDQMLGDGKSQSGAASFAGTRGIHAVEAFENTRLVGFGNANAGVGDGENHVGIAFLGAHGNAASGKGVLRG